MAGSCAPRLDAPSETAPTAAKPARRYQRSCLECGTPYATARRTGSEFCAGPCRKRFNNRRLTRGAEVYDLFMALRCDRKTAVLLKVWKLLCRLVALYREEDATARDGRRSWRKPREVLEARPYLSADTISSTRWKVISS